ncbi:DUF2726 domain-containing protein [Coleofasciculus sp. FACHB-SPT36]|uniref:DUF2726 domain-containing protein n=1 Tax=Cyanophyceae TaxID=3028117 RepID=UPI00168BB94E|nr:DUF2726 domain-containing protein [Coleofasciculus sp. FACHB-SPT36]MBD2539578.1 DUF2726 domain-containing protein [Coleofasciculus sp. FACHB-SPT36]
MDRRKRALLNPKEEATFKALQESAERCGVRIHTKMRIADVLDIEKSGLSNDEYSYALKAHFDFVVEQKDKSVAFAVEFDGSQHDSDPEAISRDAKKNSICEKLGMPLLRIDAEYLRKVGQFSIVGWLMEVWFLDQEFVKAQERGGIPDNYDFHYSLVMGCGYREGDKFVELDFNNSEATIEVLKKYGKFGEDKIVTTRPYDPFLPSRALLHKYSKGIEVLRAIDPKNRDVSVAVVKLADSGIVLGIGKCRSFRFPPVGSRELSEELSMVDAAGKLRKYNRGECKLDTAEDVDSWRDRILQWKAHSR